MRANCSVFSAHISTMLSLDPVYTAPVQLLHRNRSYGSAYRLHCSELTVTLLAPLTGTLSVPAKKAQQFLHRTSSLVALENCKRLNEQFLSLIHNEEYFSLCLAYAWDGAFQLFLTICHQVWS